MNPPIALPHPRSGGGGPRAEARARGLQSEWWRGQAPRTDSQRRLLRAAAFPLHRPLFSRLKAGFGGRSPSPIAAALGAVVALLIASPALAEGNAQHGQQVFQDQCSGCHVLTGEGIAAPALSGVFGRKAGSTGFAYSDAMKKSGIVWDDANLHGFIADPGKVVPGTAMYFNLGDAQQRDDVVAYLRTLSPASH